MSNWAFPVIPVIVTDPFGMRFHPIYHEMRLHRGTDYRCDYGQTVRAEAGGVVIWAGYNGGEGNSVHIRHDDGTVTKNFHNSSFNVSVGDRVVKGQRIAGAGTTGDSTGVHCHSEVHINGSPIDPQAFLEGQNADGGTITADSGNSTPIQEDDMYDQDARDELIGRIDQRVVGKLDQLLNRGPVFQRFRNNKSGEISIAGWGAWWPVPNIDYIKLLEWRGMVTSNTVDVPPNEYEFFKSLYLLSEANDKAVLDAVAKLTVKEVQTTLAALKAAEDKQLEAAKK